MRNPRLREINSPETTKPAGLGPRFEARSQYKARVLFDGPTTRRFAVQCTFYLRGRHWPGLLSASTSLSTPSGWGVFHVVALALPHPQDPQASSPDQPGPPGGAELCLSHEVAGQLLPQLDTAAQRRLTEGTVQQDLVRLADSEVIAEEAEMLLGVFLPRDLHAWLSGTETWAPERCRKRLHYNSLLPEIKHPLPPEVNAPTSWACPLIASCSDKSALRSWFPGLKMRAFGAVLEPIALSGVQPLKNRQCDDNQHSC